MKKYSLEIKKCAQGHSVYVEAVTRMKVPETKISFLSRRAHVCIVMRAGTLIFFQIQDISFYGHMIATMQKF